MERTTIVETIPEDEQLSLVRLATLLTGDERSGVELLARSAIHTTDHEDAIDAQDYALETARRQLVRTYISDRGGQRDDKIRRAAVALRYSGDLSVAETARALELPTDRVTSELGAAGIEGGVYEAWAALLERSPDVSRLILEIHRQRQRSKRRRRRVGILITVAALIMAAGVIVPTVVVPRLPHRAHQAGTWTFVHTVETTGEWTILGRIIDAGTESTYVTGQGGPYATVQCHITLSAPGEARERLGFDPGATEGEDFRVDGRAGKFLRPAEREFQPVVAWRYGADAWALASCSSPLEEVKATLKQFTDSIRYEPTPLTVPVRLQHLPSNFIVESVLSQLEPDITTIFLKRKPTDDWDLTISTNSGVAPDTDQIDIDGAPWSYASESAQLCSASPSSFGLCVSASWNASDSAPKRREVEVRPLLIEVAQALKLPADVSDRSTWFDADNALP